MLYSLRGIKHPSSLKEKDKHLAKHLEGGRQDLRMSVECIFQLWVRTHASSWSPNQRGYTEDKTAQERWCFTLKISPQQCQGTHSHGCFEYHFLKLRSRMRKSSGPWAQSLGRSVCIWPPDSSSRWGHPREPGPTALSALGLKISNLAWLVSRELLEAKLPITD